MQMLADGRQIANGSDEPVGDVPWMRARKSHALDSSDGAYAREQFCEVARRVVGRLVVIDDLASS
jgi:hypothetical protein